MEYQKLEKPIYWMGYTKGHFIRRKFIEYQVDFPRYLRDEDKNVRFFSKTMEKRIGQFCCVGGFSMYSYNDFTDTDKIEFLKMIVRRNDTRISKLQKEIDLINRETNKIVDIIKEKERNE